MNVSKHAKERYAERLRDKNSNYDIQKFVLEHDEKICNDIKKMINFGTLIYAGKQTQKDVKNANVISVYLNGLWVVLYDQKNDTVITLYKVDLGAGDDFNEQYVQKMLAKLETAKEEESTVQFEVQQENDGYKSMIESGVAQINEYKSYIKNLEELNAGYKTIIDNNSVRVTMASAEVANVVNTLIGKKEF